MPVTIVAVSAGLLVLGAPRWVVAAGVAIAFVPVLGLLAVAGGLAYEVATRRSPGRLRAGDTARFLRAVADDLGTGQTLLQVVAASTDLHIDGHARRLCAIGAPGDEIAAAIAPTLGRHGPGFRSAVALSETTGGSLAEALHVLADQADLDADAVRERRVATSQARFTALVVGGVPLVVAFAIVAARGVPEPGGALVVVPMAVGAMLMLVGAGLVAWMSRSVVAR